MPAATAPARHPPPTQAAAAATVSVGIAALNEDLLAHVVRYATGQPDGLPARLSDWRLALVSRAMRRAFLDHVASIALDSPLARRLDGLDWAPLARCTALKALSIAPAAGLDDAAVGRLFVALRRAGVRLRAFHVVLDKDLTHLALVLLVVLFGKTVTDLSIQISCVRRARRRRLLTDPPYPAHPHHALHPHHHPLHQLHHHHQVQHPNHNPALHPLQHYLHNHPHHPVILNNDNHLLPPVLPHVPNPNGGAQMLLDVQYHQYLHNLHQQIQPNMHPPLLPNFLPNPPFGPENVIPPPQAPHPLAAALIVPAVVPHVPNPSSPVHTLGSALGEGGMAEDQTASAAGAPQAAFSMNPGQYEGDSVQPTGSAGPSRHLPANAPHSENNLRGAAGSSVVEPAVDVSLDRAVDPARPVHEFQSTLLSGAERRARGKCPRASSANLPRDTNNDRPMAPNARHGSDGFGISANPLPRVSRSSQADEPTEVCSQAEVDRSFVVDEIFVQQPVGDVAMTAADTSAATAPPHEAAAERDEAGSEADTRHLGANQVASSLHVDEPQSGGDSETAGGQHLGGDAHVPPAQWPHLHPVGSLHNPIVEPGPVDNPNPPYPILGPLLGLHPYLFNQNNIMPPMTAAFSVNAHFYHQSPDALPPLPHLPPSLAMFLNVAPPRQNAASPSSCQLAGSSQASSGVATGGAGPGGGDDDSGDDDPGGGNHPVFAGAEFPHLWDGAFGVPNINPGDAGPLADAEGGLGVGLPGGNNVVFAGDAQDVADAGQAGDGDGGVVGAGVGVGGANGLGFVHGESTVPGQEVVLLSDAVFAAVVARCPQLRTLKLEGGKHLTGSGIRMLTRCPHLSELVICGSHLISDSGLAPVIGQAEQLRKLTLRGLSRIGHETISALTLEPKKIFQSLEVTRNMRITDRSIQTVVNCCESLRAVTLKGCVLLTNATASHLSCARNIEHVDLKMSWASPITNRSAIYISCAASSLKILALGDCKELDVDGIVALSKLPGLTTLQLYGLNVVTQDTMRVLGGNPQNSFRRLEYLVLEGALQLTDLGVRVLCGQRGHRIMGLELIDRAKCLSDEALDTIGTFCTSLKRLSIHGSFSELAIRKLHQSMPSVKLEVASLNSVVTFLD